FQGLRLLELLFQAPPLLRVSRGLEALGEVGDTLIELRLVLGQRLLPLAQRLLRLLAFAAVGLHDDGELVGHRLVVVASRQGGDQRCGGEPSHAASVAASLTRRISQSCTGLDLPFSFTGSRGAASTSMATFS